jgi:hypothetical protein
MLVDFVSVVAFFVIVFVLRIQMKEPPVATWAAFAFVLSVFWFIALILHWLWTPAKVLR